MNYDHAIIATLLEKVDDYGAHMVANTYSHLVSQLSPLFYTFSTIYLGLLFINMQRGLISVEVLPYKLLKMVFILTLALNYHYFCLFIYDIFTKEPLYICHAITIQGSNLDIVSVGNALDQFLKQGLQEANKLFSMGSWNNPTYHLFGVGVFIASILSTGIAIAIIMLAKIASVILLSLSPIFIFLLLFDTTKNLFDAYLSQLITYALIPVMVCAVLMVVLSVADSTIRYIDQSSKPSFSLLIPFGLACIAQWWLVLQIPGKCAALAAGFSLKSLSSTLSQMHGMAQKSWRMAPAGIYFSKKAWKGTSDLLDRGIQAGNQLMQARKNRYNKGK